ncbi:hypothetical protein CSPX01_00653 [Colletotrichum filicis]|nr:hypothetical protein CSPX01_00653 [Colletotrichum filicis]
MLFAERKHCIRPTLDLTLKQHKFARAACAPSSSLCHSQTSLRDCFRVGRIVIRMDGPQI